MFGRKRIVVFWILFISLPIGSFFSAETVHVITGTAPEVSENFNHSRLFLKIRAGVNWLGGDQAISVEGSFNSIDYSPIILPALGAQDYYDSDGDAGQVVEKN